MSNERSEPVGSPVKVVKLKVCFAYVVKPFTGSRPKRVMGKRGKGKGSDGGSLQWCSKGKW